MTELTSRLGLKMAAKLFVLRHLLPLTNAMLGKLSLRLSPTGRPCRDFDAFIRHMIQQGMRFNTVIDVGVAYGSPFLYRALPWAKYFLIEPVPACGEILNTLAKKIDAETYNVAAGAEDGTLDFYVHDDISGSSAYAEADTRLGGKKVTVQQRRLDTLLRGKIKRPCLLKIDTQGAELDVIQGAVGILESVDVIIMEVSFHQFRKGIPEVDDITAAMRAVGWRCYDILEGEYRRVDNALAQVDIAFVPDTSSLRAEKTFFGTA